MNSAILQSENIFFTCSGNLVWESLSHSPSERTPRAPFRLNQQATHERKQHPIPIAYETCNTLSSIPSSSAASFVSPASYICAYCHYSYTLNSGSYFVFCARKRNALRCAVVRSAHQHKNVISHFFPQSCLSFASRCCSCAH